jgi:hypothetical protein
MTKKQKQPMPTTIEREPVLKVTEIPACCPKCLSTERTGKHCVVVRRITGTLPTGQPYNTVENWRAECKNCGQRLAYNCFQNRVIE